MRKIIAAILVFVTMILSGCSVLSLDSTDIMCPPKATGNKADIQKILDKRTSGAYTLKYPKNGTHRSSIVTFDIDNDSEEEAIAFYSADNESRIHALFMECQKDNYTVVKDIVFDASNIDRIDFCDINSDGAHEVLIGYSSSTSSVNILNVYTFSKKVKQLGSSYTYSSFVTGDLNGDKNDDILLLSLFSGDISAQAKLVVHNYNDGLSEIGVTDLDPDITQFASVIYGQLCSGSYGVVIDGVSNTGDYTTQVVLYNTSEAALTNPLYSYSGYSSTRRSTPICSSDFDNDELIDIPVCSIMPYNQAEDTETILRRIDWSNYDPKTHTFATVLSTLICSADNYTLKIPQNWNNAVTARYDKEKHETTIYAFKYNETDLVLTDKLLTIKTFELNEYLNQTSGYMEIMSTGSNTYAYLLGTSDNYLSISGDEIKNLFSLVNQ